MALVPPSPRWRRTAGGHGLLEAVPRIYQVTPDIPDRRRATQQDESQTADLADSLKESQLAAGREPPFSVGRHRHRESQQQASKRQRLRRCRGGLPWPLTAIAFAWHRHTDTPTRRQESAPSARA